MFAGVTSPSRATCPNTEMRRLDGRTAGMPVWKNGSSAGGLAIHYVDEVMFAMHRRRK